MKWNFLGTFILVFANANWCIGAENTGAGFAPNTVCHGLRVVYTILYAHYKLNLIVHATAHDFRNEGVHPFQRSIPTDLLTLVMVNVLFFGKFKDKLKLIFRSRCEFVKLHKQLDRIWCINLHFKTFLLIHKLTPA